MTTSLGWLLIVLAGSFTETVFGGENCDDPDRLIVCHIETKLHPSTDPCSCTHIVLHNPHDTETLKAAQKLREKNHRLKILSLAEEGKKAQLEDVSGVYLKLSKSSSKEQVVKNVKTLATELDNLQASKRANAKYSSGSTEDTSKEFAELFLELPSSPEQLAKNYDLKSLNKYINYFIITSDNLTDSSEEGLAYHPSRLMGIDDILNADSLVDLISGLGAEHEKLLISLPATALKFNLKDPKDNMPRAKVTAYPEAISQHELCTLIENGVWTLERDEDLTAPYAYSNNTWLAFDDSVSAAIKAKYILLRGLAGISISKAEADDWNHECASRPIIDTLYGTFTNLVRKPRAATLLSLQDQIHNSITPFAGDVQLSPFRIVRVVDRAGSIHVVRKEAKTEFQCSRQGYFTHPSGCNRFYRCVKFNQYSSDFTVFEYDCPAGLAFDERYEVCVWPGSLPDASACKGSSEIAPVPRTRFACSSEGYYADPENCRWFFACLDHHGDGTPPTAYEFRCPFGLVFNEETLTCDWPWSVRGCGSGSASQSSVIYPGDILEGRLRPAYAQVSDVHVSGGRIANVDGGLVLGTNLLTGISTSGQRYSNGYGLGLAKQINSAFGSSEYQDNSGAYVHDPSGDTGGEYIHEEGLNGPGSSYYADKGTSYSGFSGGVLKGNSGQYGHDARGDYEGGYIHSAVSSGAASYSGSSGSFGDQYAGAGITGYGTGSIGVGNSDAYVHDTRGDAGGSYIHQEGSSGVLNGNSGQYGHDSRGDNGGGYIHSAVSGGTASYSGSSGSFGGQYAGAGITGYGTGSIGVGNSGAYVHDARGDAGGSYIHQEGSNGAGSKPYLYSGSSSITSGSTGSVSGQSNVYDYGSSGESEIGTGGHQSSLSFSGSRVAGTDFSGISGTNLGIGSQQSEISGEQAVYGSKTVNGLSSGGYRHDSRGDTGGVYVHQEGPSGPGSVPYVHQEGSYGDNKFIGGFGIKTNQGYTSNYNEGQNVLALGGYVGGAYSSNSESGEYSHDSSGERGGEYVHLEGPTYYKGVYANRYSGHYIHDNSGSYVHDTTGDHGEPYIHQEGPSGSLYQDLNVNNIYNSQYAGQYASKYLTDHTRPTNYVNVGAYTYQPQGGIIHTYDNSRLHVHPTGYVGSVLKPYEQNIVKNHNVSPIGLVKFSEFSLNNAVKNIGPITVTERPTIPLNPIQYVSPLKTNVLQPLSLIKESIPVISHSYSAPIIKTQTVSPLTVSSTPTVTVGNVQPISGVKTHFVQPIHVSTPSPVISYETPVIRTQTVRPVTVTSSPIVPLNPVQYEPIGPILNTGLHSYESHGFSTVSPLTIKTHSVQPVKISQSVIHSHSSNNYPEQIVVSSTPATPVASYEFRPAVKAEKVRPITVTDSPVIPLKPVLYGQKTVINTPYSGYEYPKPKVTFNYPQHIIKDHSFLEPIHSPPLISYSYHPSVSVTPVNTNLVSQTVISSTPRPELIHYQEPAIKTQTLNVPSKQIIDLDTVHYGTRIEAVGVSTQSPISLQPFNPIIKTQTAHPVIVSSTPVVPLNVVQYGIKSVGGSLGYQYPKPIVGLSYPKEIPHSTQAPPVISYTYQKPLVKTQPILPTIVSTPAPPVVSYSYQQPIRPAIPLAISTPAPPIVSYSYKKPIVPLSISAPAPPAVSYSIKTKPIQPIIVNTTPAVPLNPVQYVRPIVSSTPAPSIIDYYHEQTIKPIAPIPVSTPAPPVVSYSYQQPIVPVSVQSPVPSPISYSIKAKPVQPIIVSSTPAVPFNPVQYVNPISVSTPAPPSIHYSYHEHVKPVVPISLSTPAPPVINYSYQQPVKPLIPIEISTPAPPAVSYSYKPAAPVSVYSQAPPPISYSIKAKPAQPIIVSSTPAVPFNPVQYVNPISVSTPAPPSVHYSYHQRVKPFVPVSFSTPAPPVINYSYQQPVKPAVPVTFSTPSPPVVNYSYQQFVAPVSVHSPAPPAVSYSIKTKPIQPIIVSSTPAVPLNPVQYVNPISVSTPAPPVVHYSYKHQAKPFAPISVSTPAPPVINYSYQQSVKPAIPVAYSTPAPPVVSYSVKEKTFQPIIVTSTPAVPLNPVQYVNPTSFHTPVVHYSYNQQVKPVIPISVSTPAPPVINYSYQQSVKPAIPVAFRTPAQPVINYSYQQEVKPAIPVSFSTPSSHLVSYSVKEKQPVIVSSTPAIPLNPVQYAKPVTFSTPAPPVLYYSHHQPIKPVQPVIDYSYIPHIKPAPFSISTPSPTVVEYSVKTKPLPQLTVTSSPVVPLNPVQYVKPVGSFAPSLDYSYHTSLKPVAPISVSTPAPPVINYSYQKPILPASPVAFTTPSPFVSYSFKAKTVQPIAVSSTPIVPLNPVQYVKQVTTPAPPVVSYSTPASPVIRYSTAAPPLVSYSTPAPPVVSYSYRAKPVEPVAVSSTPIIPLNPVHYVKSVVSTPAPPTINYSYRQPVAPVVVTTPAPPVIDYSYRKPIEPYAVNKASNVVFSYSFEAKPIQPVTVSSTPAIPLNPVQYTLKPAISSLPLVNYSYRRPTIKPAVVTTSAPKISYSYQQQPEYFVKTKTIRPVAVTSAPVIPFNPVQYISTTPQPIINYKYQNPVIKAHTTVVASPAAVDYYDEEVLHRDIVKISQKPPVSSYYEVPIRTTTIAPITISSTPVVPLNPVQYVKQSLPIFSYNYQHQPAPTYQTKGCCSSTSIKVSTPKPDLPSTTFSPPTIISNRKPILGAYFEENYESNREDQGYVYSRPSVTFEERPLIKQGIYSTVSPPAVHTTSTYLQRPVQTYANTVEEESFISNLPEHVTLPKQPVPIDTNDEDLNIHLDIPKIGVNQPVYTTSNAPQQQIVEVTTVTPVVKRVKVTGGLTRGGYYVRRQKVKVQPVITTTENYPAYFTSTIKPIYSSTIDLTSPTLYRTTVRPSTVYTTSSTTLKDDELEIEDEDDDARLLAEVSGQFGEIINTGNQGIIRHGVSSTTVSSLKDGEAIIGVVKKEQLEGGRKRAKVVVVSKLSDFNPLLVGKLGAECSCKSNSKTLNLHRGSSQAKEQLFFPEVVDASIPVRGYLPSSPEPPKVITYNLPVSQAPLSDIPTSTTLIPASYENDPFVEIKSVNKAQRLYATTESPIDYGSAEYDISTKRSISNNRIGLSQEKTLSKGASFDRYGPGGLRGSDETLQGSIDCQRPGLFRHPKYCNKFYSCNWDQWKKRFTLHVFNCPIHLAYDSQLGACNWPSKGPACADDNLLV